MALFSKRVLLMLGSAILLVLLFSLFTVRTTVFESGIPSEIVFYTRVMPTPLLTYKLKYGEYPQSPEEFQKIEEYFTADSLSEYSVLEISHSSEESKDLLIMTRKKSWYYPDHNFYGRYVCSLYSFDTELVPDKELHAFMESKGVSNYDELEFGSTDTMEKRDESVKRILFICVFVSFFTYVFWSSRKTP